MNWDLIFSLTNGLAMVGWLILILLPRLPLLRTIVMYVGVGLLCATYTVLLVALMAGGVDGGAGLAGMEPGFSSLGGVRALLSSPGGAAVGWIHYLAFDLFIGLWIAADADGKQVSRWVQAPILVVTLLAGPIGLLIWLIIREPRARAAARMAKGDSGRR